MTVSEEAKEIRNEVARLRPRRGRKYKRAFRERVIAWHERAAESGMQAGERQRSCGLSLRADREVARGRAADRCDDGSVARSAAPDLDDDAPAGCVAR